MVHVYSGIRVRQKLTIGNTAGVNPVGTLNSFHSKFSIKDEISSKRVTLVYFAIGIVHCRGRNRLFNCQYLSVLSLILRYFRLDKTLHSNSWYIDRPIISHSIPSRRRLICLCGTGVGEATSYMIDGR